MFHNIIGGKESAAMWRAEVMTSDADWITVAHIWCMWTRFIV